MQLPETLHSALDAHSPEAAAIARLAWALNAGAGAILVVVMAFVAHAVRARPAWLAQPRTVVWGGIVAPIVLLTVLLAYSTIRGLATAAAQPAAAVRIQVVGQQWWWRVRYLDANGAPEFETANEIRLPVGERVELALESADVLHAFWVPSLAGKRDMIPGRVNTLAFTPRSAGVFRGQCAEYCGGPHAQMALHVVTQPAEEFERWRNGQRLPAAAGDALFEAHCAVCHTVRGTSARGGLGPDLTHVGSRLTIAAGTLPLDTPSLAEWIASSQHVKPGNLMPAFAHLPRSDREALAVYLASLR